MAKQLFFQNVAATFHRGVNDAKLAGAASWWLPRLLAESRGSGATTATAASVAGTTVGIEFTSGAVALEWISEPLSADFTISGTITANLWGLESTMNDNTAINVVVEKIDGATGAVTQIAKTARVTELGTSNGVNNFTVTPTSTACKRGDRLRVRPFIDDIGTAMIVGTSTFSYAGPTAAAAGDSYVQFTENLTFELDPGVLSLEQAVRTSTLEVGRTDITTAQGQSFVAAGSLTELRIRLQKVAAPTDDLVVELQTDSSGKPSGSVVATIATVAAAGLTTSVTEYIYTGSWSLTSGATYWVVVRRSGALDFTNYFQVGSGVNAAWTGSKSYSPTTGNWSTPFAESVTLRLVFSGVPVSTYYLTDTAETINPGAATEKRALTTRGSGSATAVTNTAAGPTAGIQVTGSAGGTALEWYTPALEAVTLGGKAKVNIRALESSAAANASLKAEIAVCATDGTSPVVWGVANVASDLTLGGEVGTSDAATVAWVSGDDVSVTAGHRLRFRIYIDDSAIGPLVTGSTVTVSYAGTTAAAAGDTYVTLPVTVVEQSVGPVTRYGATSLNFGFLEVTAARRKTFATVAMPATFAAVVAGNVTVPAVTHYGQAAVSLTFGELTQASRRTFGLLTVPLAFAKATAAQRKTFGVTATPLSFLETTAGRKQTFGQIARPFTVGFVTAGIATTGAVTYFGQVAVPFTFGETTAARRRTFGATAAPFVFGEVTAGRRTAFSTLAVPFTFTKAVQASRRTFAATATPLTFGEVTAGRRRTFSTLAAPFTFTKAVQAQRRTTGATATPFTFGTVTNSRKQYGRVAAPYLFGELTQARKHTYGIVTRPFTVSIVTAGIGFTGAATYFGATAVQLTFGEVTAGRKKTFAQTAAPFTFSKAVQGQRRTFAQLVVSYTFVRATQAQRRTTGQIVRPFTVAFVTAGVSTVGIVTHYGQLIVPLAFTKDVRGRKKTFALVTAPFTFGEQTQASRRTFGATATPLHIAFATSGLALLAPILNYAQDIRWGAIQADAVYVGDELVWTPAETRKVER